MSIRFPAAVVAAAFLAPAALAQDRPGTVRVVQVKTIWKADGMTVPHVQFTPDGSRIVFVAEGRGGRFTASIRPDGSDFRKEATPSPRPEPDAGVPGGPYKCAAAAPGGTLAAATKDLPSPVGIVRGAGLWVWRIPRPGEKTADVREVLSPKEWLVGVAYYKHLIAWAPPGPGEKDSRRIRFVGARLRPFPGMKHRPLCVWEVTINGRLKRVGGPKRLGTFGWWPRYFRGDPALHGATGWNVGIGSGQYLADFRTGRVYKFNRPAFGRTTRASYNPGCTLAALPGRTLRVLHLEKKE